MKNSLSEFFKSKDNSKTIILTSLIALAILIFTCIMILFGVDQSVFIDPDADNNNITERATFLETVRATHQSSSTTFNLEVADTEQEKREGLMFRTTLEPQSGMLFIFDEEQMLTFWMKNTLISLDIIYLNNNQEVVSLSENTIPNQTDIIYPSIEPAKYAIELKGGSAAQFKINIGDVFIFE